MHAQKVWLVTGASKGLGLSLIKMLLTRGFRVAATSRSREELIQAAGAPSGSFLPLAVDVRSEHSVQQGVDEIIEQFGRIDVLVNNAGYGMLGGLEELSDEEARANFDINVFGSLNMIRSVLPHMRKQSAGHVLNVSSIGGFSGLFPGFGIYCATKFAVQGFTESLSTEIKAFGLFATIVSPGYFRTNFLTPDSLRVPAHPLDAYEAVRASQQAHEESINGNQPGDPDKAAAAMIAITEVENPPLHLFLGEDAYKVAYQKIALVTKELETWKSVTIGTNFTEEASKV